MGVRGCLCPRRQPFSQEESDCHHPFSKQRKGRIFSLQKKGRIKKRHIAGSFYLLLILLILLTTATYTWFSLSKTPRVSDLYLTVNAGAGLELTLDLQSEDWGQQINFADTLADVTPLKPVTWSQRDQRFYAAVFGADGRIAGIQQPLSDEHNANRSDSSGYYVKGTFYARTGEPVTVSLSPAVEIDQGTQGAGTYLIGTPVWNEQTILHDNGGGGAEYAVRIGLRLSKWGADGVRLEEDPIFYIYEPNADRHIDGSTGYRDTPSIDGTGSLVPQERLIRQSVSTWSEADPIQKNVVIRELGEFTTPTQLFELTAQERMQIDLYVWLEGQDADCINRIGQAAQIMANIQFSAEGKNSSGLYPIA